MSGFDWPEHPDDEWIDVTRLGSPVVERILGRSGSEQEVADARERYVAGQIGIDEFEAVLDRVLGP